MADSDAIARAVDAAIRQAATQLRPDVAAALRACARVESSKRGRWALDQLVHNAEIASRDGVPLCQDTGTVWVWLEVGAGEQLASDLHVRINQAVARAYSEAGLRMSVARDALFDRTNSGDNTPAFIDISVSEGTGVTVHVMLKGAGSDNGSALAMLDPGAGPDGVVDFVVSRIAEKGASMCPPLVLGVCVGGTFDSAPKLAKRALLKSLDAPAPDPATHEFEQRLLRAVNSLGIGPGGLGGDTTALKVNLVTSPCHIASMPVALNVGCSALRSVSVHVE